MAEKGRYADAVGGLLLKGFEGKAMLWRASRRESVERGMDIE